MDFLKLDRTFELTEERGFWEDFFFDHKFDKDVELWRRDGLSLKAGILLALVMLIVLARLAGLAL